MAKVKRRSARGPRRAAWRRPTGRVAGKQAPEPAAAGPRGEALGMTANEELETAEGEHLDDEL